MSGFSQSSLPMPAQDEEDDEDEDDEEEKENYSSYGSSSGGGCADTESLNEYVMCYLKGRHRKIGVFKINPPFEGTFFLKVYAKPEDEILNEVDDTLDHIATFTIHVKDVSNSNCTKWYYREESRQHMTC